MRTFRLLFLGPLSIFCCSLSAQVDDLMRDKNITWIAEFYSDVVTEQALEGKVNGATNFVSPLKFVNNTEGSLSEEYILQNIILEAVKNGKLKVYQDVNCTLTTTYDNIVWQDTIMYIDPYTYKIELKTSNRQPVFNISGNPVFMDKLAVLRVHQILFYDAKKVQFGVRTLAIAPMIERYDNGQMIGLEAAFWIKAKDLTKKRRLSDKSITWAKQFNLRNAIDLNKDSVKVLKQTDLNSPKHALFSAFRHNKKIQFYKPNETNMTTKYSLPERKDFFDGMDTIEQIDPTTYEMKTRIIWRCYPTLDYDYLGLIQNWYWDDKKKRLEVWLSATSVLKNIRNDAGETMFKQPLFYRRTDD